MDSVISEIKKELRAAMNGPRSQYMRESGLRYHVIFGVDLPRLGEIAAEFEPDNQVAQQLWSEDVRESKILATMLLPLEACDRAMADLWASQVPNEEIAGYAVMHVFSRVPFAADLAFEWIASERPLHRLMGFLIANRLMQDGAEWSPRAEQELHDQAQAALAETDHPAIRRAAARCVDKS